MPAQNLRGVWRPVEVLWHFGIRNATLGIQELEDNDEQDQETGGGPLKHGAGEAKEKTHIYMHAKKKKKKLNIMPLGCRETWMHTFNHFTHSCKR